MATWDQWFPMVLVHAPTAPDPLVRQALCRAAREFMRRTLAWMEWLEATKTAAGIGMEYDFELPTQTELVRVDGATVSGVPLDVQSYRQAVRDWTAHPDAGRSLVTRDMATFTLQGSFAASESVQVKACLMPTIAATGIPDHLASRYWEAIGEGAKSILLLTRGDFYQPDLAAVAKGEFQNAIAEHAVDVHRGGTAQTPRSRPKWC